MNVFHILILILLSKHYLCLAPGVHIQPGGEGVGDAAEGGRVQRDAGWGRET